MQEGGSNKLAMLLLLSGSGAVILGSGLGWGALPKFIQMKVTESKYLVPGSEGRLQFENKPVIPLVFKAFVFNTTNYWDVHSSGAKPILQEIGPYYFIEIKDKVAITDDDDGDTMSYNVKNTWIFDKQSSLPLTGDEIVYLPHPAMLGILYQAERDQAAFLTFVEMAIREIFNRPKSIFMRTTVMDFLFNGNFLNCTTKGIFTIVVCSTIRKSGAFPEVKKGLFEFSIFGSRNGTRDPGRFQVSRGTRDVSTVGRLVTYDGRAEQPVWAGMPCNSIAGTDATVFPPFINGQDIDIFSTDICRSLKAKFLQTSSFKGVPTMMYSGGFGDMSVTPEMKCFCSKPTKCKKQGVMDVSKCVGAPLYASLPHFYDSHEDYLNGVDGLNPNETLHRIILQLEAMSGIPMEIKKRLQYSIPIRPIRSVRLTSRLPKTLVPLFWVEEGLELSDELVGELNDKLLNTLAVVDAGKWTVTGVGVGATVAGALLKYHPHRYFLPSTSTPITTMG